MQQKNQTLNLCVTAILTALNVAMSSFGIPVPGGHLYINDIVICTASIVLNPLSAFVVGGIGAFLGDLVFNPDAMLTSLVTRGLQTVVISLVSHNMSKKKPALSATVGVILGAVIMITGYSLGRAFIYRTPQYAIIKLPYQILQAVVGAVGAMLICFKCGIYNLYNKKISRK